MKKIQKDQSEKNVETEKNKYVYDKVIFCIGSETNDYGIHGVNEHAFKFKTDEVSSEYYMVRRTEETF